ncbi:hypothetical protein N7513_009905 [Penicillium frequentans]|uniref:Uncharacterized protein n=1 Tax=Penicillium frequentans TaxID=3151616 RepID=A0AAD6CJM8_9EURO|nr:hypothetical protein N7494_011438 [Penicillium glabrum]KAJ5536719.1 hypothetical protein N7513_009905 [Penicillium glabrum]
MSDQSKNREPPKVDNEADSDKGQDNSQPQKVAASTPYMPQSGKPAGETEQTAQKTESETDKNPRDKVAASTPYMPQAGKPAGNSSL